jgi:hypothetical protein
MVMKQKYLLLTMILFVFLFLFSTISFALIPGDFGSANNGPPDGVVDFEDLMIFAMAYGSTPSDANWNEACDIAGLGGSLNPDGVIDFEDLMIFALHYGERERATWIVMVYMSGDQSGSSSLDLAAWLDLEEMESIGSTDQVKVVVQLDPYDSCTGTYRYYVTGANKGLSYPLYPDDIVGSLPEQNMSDPSVLANFVNWATTNYPADHYLLVLWDHGGGWKEEGIINRGIMWDYTPSYSYMSMEDLADGLDSFNEHIDIIGFDACLMQMIEVAYQIESQVTDAPNYMIGSEESIWGLGWNYYDILNHLTLSPTMSAATLGETIVDDFLWNSGVTTATLSVINLNNFHSIADPIFSAFQLALRNSAYQSEIATARSSAQSYSYSSGFRCKDIYDFAQIIKDNVPDSDCQSKAQAVMDLINSVIVAEGHTGPGMDNSHGLSIYLPDSSGNYDSSYDTLQFAIDTQWDEFLLTGGGTVSAVWAIAWTYLPSKTKLMDIINELENENVLPESYKFMEYNEKKGLDIYHAIGVEWKSYYGATGYKIYRSINGGSYSIIYQNEPTTIYDGYSFYDYDVEVGIKYSYYVIAYGDSWQTTPSNNIDIDTFLPVCSLISPVNVAVNDPTPVFTWSPVGLGSGDFPYGTSGAIKSGNSNLTVWSDYCNGEKSWDIYFDDMVTSQAVYNQDGNAIPLVNNHSYIWESEGFGCDENHNLIAISWSGNWEFTYE